MRWPWPWKRRRDGEIAAAQAAKEAAGRVLREERRRLAEVQKLAGRLAERRKDDAFAEALRVAFGGRR